MVTVRIQLCAAPAEPRPDGEAKAAAPAATEPPRPDPPATAGAPAVVTPGGPGERPRIDVEWYLAQQILPPIARADSAWCFLQFLNLNFVKMASS